jgi:2'-5' RNA ligase
MADRCFVAVDIDDPGIMGRIVAAQERIAATGADVKPVEEENIHVTLRFLGEIPEAKTAEAAGVVRGIRFAPFRIRFRGVGVFPSLSRPSVVWVGIEGGVGELLAVFSELEGGLTRIGFERERRGFQPHVTVCRVQSGRNRAELAEAVTKLGGADFGEMDIRRILLKRSVLTPRGPIYSTVAESGAP